MRHCVFFLLSKKKSPICLSLELERYIGVGRRNKSIGTVLSLKYLRLEKYFPHFNAQFCKSLDCSWHFEKLEMDALSGSGDKQLFWRGNGWICHALRYGMPGLAALPRSYKTKLLGPKKSCSGNVPNYCMIYDRESFSQLVISSNLC